MSALLLSRRLEEFNHTLLAINDDLPNRTDGVPKWTLGLRNCPGALAQGLDVQVGKIGFLGQAEGRHLRRQVQTSRRNMAEQGRGDSSGQRRQRPTALPGRPLDQELRISQGGVAPRSHGGASG